jgi:hypothetical protein
MFSGKEDPNIMSTISEKPDPHCRSCEQTIEWHFDAHFEVWFHECIGPISKKQARQLEKLVNPDLKEPCHTMDDEEEEIHEQWSDDILTDIALRLDAYVRRLGLASGAVKLVLHRDANGIEVEACQLVGDRDIWSRFYDAFQSGEV